MRLISVTMGGTTPEKRTTDTLAMLDYGFNMYNIDVIIHKNKVLGNIRVNLGDKERAEIISMGDINILNNSQKEKRKITYELTTENITAPVKKGDIVGKINVYENGRYLLSEDITITENIKKANIFKIFLRNLRDIFGAKI